MLIKSPEGDKKLNKKEPPQCGSSKAVELTEECGKCYKMMRPANFECRSGTLICSAVMADSTVFINDEFVLSKVSVG